MKNCKIVVKGKIATITIDLSKDHGASASGKTEIIATTSGNKEIAAGIFIGVNCYRYPDSK